jgi:uncharacterized FlgJ-related protein
MDSKVIVEAINIQTVKKFIYSLPFTQKEIVLAQSIFESGWFSSKLFKRTNNLFGMKMPKSRETTAIKSSNGYAVYEDWKKSIIDYLLLQKTLNITSKSEYYHYLNKRYSENGKYSKNIKSIIRKLKKDEHI